MPSTERIHDLTTEYYQELAQLPGYTEASQKLMGRIRMLVVEFEKDNNINLGHDWRFNWTHTPSSVANLHAQLMGEFPGVKALKEKYKDRLY